jgi:hypothetical protein
MYRVIITWSALSALLWAPLHAQDSSVTGQPAPELRQRIEARFGARVKEQLGLTDDQMTRLRAAAMKFGDRRRTLEQRQVGLRRALADQLKPGVAASKDSVARLTDDLVGGRVAYAQSFKDELAELRTFLDPVQRARLLGMRERLLRRARELKDRREDASGGARGRRRAYMDR